MDAAHLHMELVNRQRDAGALYIRCEGVLSTYSARPGESNDPGDQASYAVAVALGRAVKDYIFERAAGEFGMDPDGAELTASLYSTFLGHIPDEALGDAFYTWTRTRYLG